MADNNLDIEQVAEAFQKLQQAMDPYRSTIVNADDALKEYEDQLQKTKKAQEDFARSAITGAAKFGTNLAKASGSFSELNPIIDLTSKAMGSLLSIIPVVGGALKGMAEGAGEATKLVLEQFQVGWNAYKELQDIGLASSFEDMKNNAGKLEVRFEDMGKALKANATDIANFGGGTAVGLKAFTKTAEALGDTRDQFRRLGISAEEFTSFQAKYQAQETRLGRARNQDLAEGTKNYIEQLDTLSKLTGLSRKDLQAQRDAALSETRFAASTSLLSKKVQETALDLNSLITSKGGPALAQGFRDLMSGAVTTDAAKALVTQTGGQVQEIVAKVRDGTLSSTEAFNQLSKSFDPVKMAHFAQYVGDASIASQNFAEAQKLFNAGKISQKDLDEIKKARDATVKGENKQTAALADTEKNLYNTGIVMQTLATSSDTVAKSMETLSDGVDDLAIKIADITGTALPQELVLRKQQRDSMKEENRLREEINKAKDEDVDEYNMEGFKTGNTVNKKRELMDQLAAQQAKTARIQGNRNSARTQEGLSQVQTVGAPKDFKPEDAMKLIKFTNGTGDEKHFNQLDAGVKANFLSMVAEYGKPIQLNSAFRSFEEQGAINSGNNPKADPGKSLHNFGRALDIQPEQVNALNQAGLLKKYGFSPLNGDPPHIETRAFGGRVSVGSQYLVGEQGPEVITAGSNGMVTPNSVFDGGFKMLGDKMDHLADLLSEGNSTRKKVLQKARA